MHVITLRPILSRAAKAGGAWYGAIIVAALVVGGILRFAGNGQPFPSSDHAELAAIVTYFYPRSTASGDSRATWHILTSAHGVLPPFLALASTTIIGLLQIAITEWWWNFPFVVISLASVVVGAQFAESLAGRRAGMFAALLLAVLPIHAAMSRASGLSHITLMGLCQMVSLWCFMRYYREPTARRAHIAGLSLSVALLVELFFPVLLALLFAVGVLSVGGGKSLRERFQRTRSLFSAPQVLLAPLAVIIVTAMVMFAYAAGLVPQGGTFSRIFGGSDRQAGLYLGAFWANGSFTAGTTGFALLSILGLLGLPMLARLEERAAPLLWSVAYLSPFLLFTRENVYGYFLMGLMGLSLNAAIVLSALWEHPGRRRFLARLLMPVLAAVLVLRALAMVFGIGTGWLIGEGVSQGGLYPDQGLKAAAWWIRDTTAQEELIFADGQFEPYQIWYYTRRPAIAITDAASPAEAYQALATSARPPALYMLPPQHEPLLNTYVPERPPLLLAVTENGRPVLHVYGFGRPGTVTQLDIAEGNRNFDRDLGNAASMFSLPGGR